MGKVIFSSILFYSTFSLAQFSGNWQGSGQATDALEKTFPCPQFKLAVLQNEKSLMIHNGFFGCGSMEMPWEFPEFAIKENQLFHQGKKIGAITKDRIKFDFENGIIQRVDISLEGKEMVYREFWVNRGANSYIMSFEGKLLQSLLD